MRIVVTGASGFIGQWVVRQLSAIGMDVIGVSRSKMNGHNSLRVSSYQDTPKGDVLIHLAEDPNLNIDHTPNDHHDNSAVDTLSGLLSLGFRQVVYASSAAVYGSRSSRPHLISDPLIGEGLYVRTKLACEERVLAEGGSVVRLSNVYGPGMSKNNVFSDILSQIYKDEPIRVRDARAIRDFIYVSDTVEAINKIIDKKSSGVFNVGTGVGTAIGDLVQYISDIAGAGDVEVIETKPVDRQSCLILDIVETKKALNWAPTITLFMGIHNLLPIHH